MLCVCADKITAMCVHPLTINSRDSTLFRKRFFLKKTIQIYIFRSPIWFYKACVMKSSDGSNSPPPVRHGSAQCAPTRSSKPRDIRVSQLTFALCPCGHRGVKRLRVVVDRILADILGGSNHHGVSLAGLFVTVCQCSLVFVMVCQWRVLCLFLRSVMISCSIRMLRDARFQPSFSNNASDQTLRQTMVKGARIQRDFWRWIELCLEDVPQKRSPTDRDHGSTARQHVCDGALSKIRRNVRPGTMKAALLGSMSLPMKSETPRHHL